MTRRIWTQDEIDAIVRMKDVEQLSQKEIAQLLHATPKQVENVYYNFKSRHSELYAMNVFQTRNKEYVTESHMPAYSTPLEQTGDCLVLPDVEIPFHHAEFINRCIDLAISLGVKNLNLAGDVLHLNSISKWEANWKPEMMRPYISEKAMAKLYDLLPTLPASAQPRLIQTLQELEEHDESDFGSEIRAAERELVNLAEPFDDVVYVLGNHDGRILSALNSPMFAKQLLKMITGENPKIRIAPYYYSILNTSGGVYRITHPTSAAQNTAVSLATQFQCHIIMGHSHIVSRLLDPSGNYWAIQAGCCVDETRLTYAAQRDRGIKRHALGAVLVYDGYPFELTEKTPFEALKKMR